jgi:hypothetical protein
MVPGWVNAVYERTAARVRELGIDDFNLYAKEIDPQTKARWWRSAGDFRRCEGPLATANGDSGWQVRLGSRCRS